MILNTSFNTIIIFPTISHIKISFSYHQIHNSNLSLNKTNLSFSVQQIQSVPVCVGSNYCYNSNKVFIFNICMCVCVDVRYLDEVSDELYAYILSTWVKSEGKNIPVPVVVPAATSVPDCQYEYCKHIM
jgi:hypothetical protein